MTQSISARGGAGLSDVKLPSLAQEPRHTVQPGETLQQIARAHGLSLKSLLAANPQLHNPDVIYPGTRLHLPDAPGHYTVRRGDTLAHIAHAHGLSLATLVAANPQLRNPDRIEIGERLHLPSGPAHAAKGSQPPAQASLWQRLLDALPALPHYSFGSGTSHGRSGAAAVGQARPLTHVAPSAAAATAPRAAFDLQAFTNPALGSHAGAAIVIGHAEGTRRADGRFTAAYAGHTDPGNGVRNQGSFSYQHAASSPADADRRQLQHLQTLLPRFEASARQAGLNPNDARLASAYLDLHNQSERASERFIEQLGSLGGRQPSAAELVDLRVHSFVDPARGERYRLPSGRHVGGGFEAIARRQLGRDPSEAEVLSVIRADQQRRTEAVDRALQGLRPAGAQASTPAGTAAGTAPRWLDIARGELGTREIRGSQHSARVLEYHQATSLKARDDETSWCSSFVNWTMQRAGVQGTGSAAARSWLAWGQVVPKQADQVRPGDVIVFPRGNNPRQGHVAIISEVLTDGRVKVVGGNQSTGPQQADGVTESVRSLASALGVRRAPAQ